MGLLAGGTCLHGEIDEEDAFAGWSLRLEFYDGQSQSVGGESVVGGYWLNPEWTYAEGRAVAPAGADRVRIKLFGTMTSGWVTYDDVSLRACDGGGTQAAPGAGIQDVPEPAERDLARAGRVRSPEDILSRQKPRWRYENLVECEDPEGCPEVAPEELTKVQWAPVSDIDRDIGRSLMGDLAENGGETKTAPESSGSVVVKRYVFGGQVVAMRHDGELFFLRPDHLGSASLIQDGTGRWLADHRFYPYGETRRRDGASESYPTDKLFTGMLSKERLGIYRMGARWLDPSISRWLSADTLVPDPTNPQSLNRYSWVLGNPLRYSDPSGHGACGGDDHDPACEEDFSELLDTLPDNELLQWIVSIGLARIAYYETGIVLAMWLSETGDEVQVFGPMYPLTQEIASDPAVDEFLAQWAEAGHPTQFTWKHSIDPRNENADLASLAAAIPDFAQENAEMILAWLVPGPTESRIDAVGGIFGSFDEIEAMEVAPGITRISVENSMGLASLTRTPGSDDSRLPNRERDDPGIGGTVIHRFYWFISTP